MKDFYYILGTDENCTFDEIKDAYRKLSKKFHPDLNQNDRYFESRFKELQEAYETLSDPSRRRKYDAALKKYRAAGPTFQGPKRQPFSTTGIDILFSIVLIIITFVFGSYVLRAMNGDTPKTPKAISKAPLISNIVLAAPKRHKKKHNFKIKAITSPVEAEPAAITIHSIKPVPPVAVTPKPVIAVVKPSPAKAIFTARQVADSNQTAPHQHFLYATYIKSNITGVINMHQLDNYGSAIVKVIPTNSKVFVLAKGGTYYKVLFDNASGYVPKWTLEVN
jgi:hypothetical protein